MIEKQEEQVTMSFSILCNELQNFKDQLERKDDFIIKMTNENSEVNKENMKRYDANMECLRELIQIIDRQEQKTQERADRIVDMLIGKIEVDININKK
jgi:GTPase involved in cell partitioning and DNA repair